MKKDKKTKANKPIKQRPSYYSQLLKEILEELKYNKLYYGTIFILVFFALISIYFQYNFEKAQRLDRKKDSEVDYYDMLGLDSSADLATINKKYRELAKIWHPDKNPGCSLCHEKFREITTAHEILSKDASLLGNKSVFRSNPAILTTRNYHKFVEMSNDLWVVLVYENTKGSSYVDHVKAVWDEIGLKNKNIVKFGVIDVLSEEDLLHFLPYKFQYFPNVFTYNNGQCELFSKLDQISPATLQQFIENSFVSRVELIDEFRLKALLKDLNKMVDVSKITISFTDLDLQVINLSSRSYVDLATKDFSMMYSSALKIYQNVYGEYEKSLNIIRAYGVSRSYLIYNKIINKKGEFIMERSILSLPVFSKYESVIALQKSFDVIKGITLLRVFSQTYNKHCINKRLDEGGLEQDQTTDLCVIFLENKLNKNQDQTIFKSFIQVIQEKFEEKIKDDIKEKNVNINYAIADTDMHFEIASLLSKYQSLKNLVINKEENLFMIINNTNEHFTFKQFKTSEALMEYFTNLDNNDYFEDISLSFDFLPNYEIKTAQNLFIEEKHFSIIKAVISSIHSQFQAKHVFGYMLVMLLNKYFLRYNGTKFIIAVFTISSSLSFLLSLIFFFI